MDDAPRRAGEGGFYGRRIGKPLRAAQANDRAAALESLALDLSTPAPADLASLFSAPVNAVRLEIGFGGGEHLLAALRREAGTGFIGAEPFVNGMAKFCRALIEQPAPNIRLHAEDALPLLDWLPPASLDGIDLFYPDPWTKKRHWKRRFVSAANLDRFARVLKPGGLFRFASDIDHYVNWTLATCDTHPDFDWQADGPADWTSPHEGWVRTRYEAKAIREGRTPCYLRFRRV
ncbi:MAG: tRNA (guanine(46)-N(7))-methyltransferase TrmB [Rhizobiaceae bacterium]|nr:tRNA (guanine(46)-N(7))-methyltransferase TrmB [Rhizobiaceae bacterium]